MLICFEVDASLNYSIATFLSDWGSLTFALGYLINLEGKNLAEGLAMTLLAGMKAIKSSKD